MKDRKDDSVQADKAKNCARMDVVAKLIDQGIVPPPGATDAEMKAIEYANGYMRNIVAAALSEDC